MLNFSLHNSRFLFRAVLLTGVLAGLLFSCGEGIRLLPFPPEAATRENSGWKSGAATVYQKNLHRFESRQGNQPAKIKRDNQHLYRTNSAYAPAPAPRLSFSSVRASTVLPDSGIFKSRLFSFVGAGRAPPFAS
jgi:hypothetical protein